jgi:hypothetical protein
MAPCFSSTAAVDPPCTGAKLRSATAGLTTSISARTAGDIEEARGPTEPLRPDAENSARNDRRVSGPEEEEDDDEDTPMDTETLDMLPLLPLLTLVLSLSVGSVELYRVKSTGTLSSFVGVSSGCAASVM